MAGPLTARDTLRAASEIINHLNPLINRPTPTIVPIAQAELDGQCAQINPARSRVTNPSNNIQPDPLIPRNRKNAAISKIPSTRKNAPNSSVSVATPSSGWKSM